MFAAKQTSTQQSTESTLIHGQWKVQLNHRPVMRVAFAKNKMEQ